MTTDSANLLKKQATRSAFWSLIDKIGVQGLSAVVGLFMTRLLFPSDYGLIAMLDIFIAVGLLLTDGGLGQAFIHDQNASHDEQSMIFYINTICGMFIYLLLFLLSNSIAAFYAQPQLIPIIRIFSLNIPIQAMSMLQQARLMKELRLQVLTKIKLFSLCLAGGLGIFLSFKGWGAWALVYYMTSYNLSNTLLLFFFSGWHPHKRPDFKFIPKYIQYASKIMSASLLDALYTNFFTMFINKAYQATTGGLYAKARLLQNIPVMSALQVIQGVSFPVLSKVQNDEVRFLQVFKKQVKVLSFLMSLIMGIMVLTARPFVILILTGKWLPMVPYFQLLCILGWLTPFQNLHTALLNAKGRSDLSLRLEIIKKIIAVSSFLLTFSYGVAAIIIAQIAAAFIGLLLNLLYSRRLTGYTIFRQLFDLFIPLLTAAGIVGLLLFGSGYFSNNILLFFLETILVTLLYISAAWVLKFNEIGFLKDLLKSGFVPKTGTPTLILDDTNKKGNS